MSAGKSVAGRHAGPGSAAERPTKAHWQWNEGVDSLALFIDPVAGWKIIIGRTGGIIGLDSAQRRQALLCLDGLPRL